MAKSEKSTVVADRPEPVEQEKAAADRPEPVRRGSGARYAIVQVGLVLTSLVGGVGSAFGSSAMWLAAGGLAAGSAALGVAGKRARRRADRDKAAGTGRPGGAGRPAGRSPLGGLGSGRSTGTGRAGAGRGLLGRLGGRGSSAAGSGGSGPEKKGGGLLGRLGRPSRKAGSGKSGTGGTGSGARPGLLGRLLGGGKSQKAGTTPGGKAAKKAAGKTRDLLDRGRGKKKDGSASASRWWRRPKKTNKDKAPETAADPKPQTRPEDVVVPKVPEVLVTPPDLPEPQAVPRPEPRPEPTRTNNDSGGIPMGAISDAGEALATGINKADMTSARKLEALLGEIVEFEERVALAKKNLAGRITEEFPADPGIAEMVYRQATTQAKFASDARDVGGALRKAHQHEWERLDNPRTNEQAWDQQTNQE